MQIYVDKAEVEAAREGSFSDLKQLIDLGDIVGVTGGIKVTFPAPRRDAQLGLSTHPHVCFYHWPRSYEAPRSFKHMIPWSVPMLSP